MNEVRIRIAGNTAEPCLLVLISKGYKVTRVVQALSDDFLNCVYDWSAEKDGQLFSATSPEELLGLVTMWENRGNDWKIKVNEKGIYKKVLDESPLFDQKGNLVDQD